MNPTSSSQAKTSKSSGARARSRSRLSGACFTGTGCGFGSGWGCFAGRAFGFEAAQFAAEADLMRYHSPELATAFTQVLDYHTAVRATLRHLRSQRNEEELTPVSGAELARLVTTKRSSGRAVAGRG